MRKRTLYFLLIIILIVLSVSIINIGLNKKHEKTLHNYNIINISDKTNSVLRSEIAIAIPKILGVTDDWALQGINSGNPSLIEVYSDYSDIYGEYDKTTLGYIGFSVYIVCSADGGYQSELRPNDILSKREALEYILRCVENDNADQSKNVINRALRERIIGLDDLISFADLDKPISRKQYNSLIYRLLNHKRYLYFERGKTSAQHDLDSYFNSSMRYKQYLEELK